MRFGKKLALMMEANAAKTLDRPYISHRRLKEILTLTTKSLRLESCHTVNPGLEEFKHLLESDLEAVLGRTAQEESDVRAELAALVSEGKDLGFLGTDRALELIGSIQNVFVSPCIGLHAVAGDGLRSAWFALTLELASFAEKFNQLTNKMQSILSYADLNVAGFRKLIKQYEKQIPRDNRIPVIAADSYRQLVVGLVELAAEFESIKPQIETVMQALSPGSPTLLVLRIGGESLQACSGMLGTIRENAKDGSLTRSTASPGLTPGPVIHTGFDLMDALKQDGLDTVALQAKLLRM